MEVRLPLIEELDDFFKRYALKDAAKEKALSDVVAFIHSHPVTSKFLYDIDIHFE